MASITQRLAALEHARRIVRPHPWPVLVYTARPTAEDIARFRAERGVDVVILMPHNGRD